MQKLKTVGQNSGVLYTFVGLEDLAKKSWKCSRCPQWWCQSRWGQQLQEDVCKVLCNTTTKNYHITAEHDKRYIKTHHSLASRQSGWSSTAQCPWKKDNYHIIKQRKTVISPEKNILLLNRIQKTWSIFTSRFWCHRSWRSWLQHPCDRTFQTDRFWGQKDKFQAYKSRKMFPVFVALTCGCRARGCWGGHSWWRGRLAARQCHEPTRLLWSAPCSKHGQHCSTPMTKVNIQQTTRKS